MKIQTSAYIYSFSVDEKKLNLKDQETIELEFSAIDTGGGFKDPILDFSIPLGNIDIPVSNPHKIILELQNPNDEDHSISFSYEEPMTISPQEINGRLKEEQLSRELIGFVLHLLR